MPKRWHSAPQSPASAWRTRAMRNGSFTSAARPSFRYGADGARLADPALRRRPPQLAARRPPAAPRPSVGDPGRTSEQIRLAADRPEARVDAWLEILGQPWVPRAFETGYARIAHGPVAEHAPPVMIVPSFVESLFGCSFRRIPEQPTRRSRSLFHRVLNGWLDLQGRSELPKAWLAGFCPRLAWGESRARWRTDYPDGRLVALLRDPRAWYASARSHAPDQRYGDLDTALNEWRQGTSEIADAKREAPDQVFVATYERLVAEPEAVMRALADWLEIDWAPSLLEPTFNRSPVPPNSSFDIPTGGVRQESLERWRDELDQAQRSLIEERDLATYDAVRKLADAA